MILYINTTDKITEIKFFDDKVSLVDELSFDGSFILSEELLQRADSLLSKNGCSKKDLKMIVVNIGPGSYTGVRIGVTAANLIAFSLDIPVVAVKEGDNLRDVIGQATNEKKFRSPALPIYKNPPHITKKRWTKTSSSGKI